MSRFYDRPIKVTLKLSIPLSLEELQGPHLQWGQSSTGSLCELSIISLFPISPLHRGSCFHAVQLKEKDSKHEGDRGGTGHCFSTTVCVHHVSWPLLAFMFCLAESPAPAASVSSLKICVPRRQEMLSPASISDQLRIAVWALLSPC